MFLRIGSLNRALTKWYWYYYYRQSR